MRKAAVALIAAGAIAAAAGLATTPLSAHGFVRHAHFAGLHHHPGFVGVHRFHHRRAFSAFAFVGPPSVVSCWRWVPTRFGPRKFWLC